MTATATTTASRRSHYWALASLFLAATGASGQIIFIPTSRIPMTSSRGLAGSSNEAPYNEPPCRQRRLEPFRQLVREECRLEASVYCSWEHPGEVTPDVRDLTAASLQENAAQQMALLFDTIFSPYPSTSSGTDWDYHFSHDVDPFSRIFDEMISYSLRAYDESASANSEGVTMSPPMYKESSPTLDVKAAVPTVDKSNPNVSTVDVEDNETVEMKEEEERRVVPEQAAEHALDVAVAELARRSIHGATTSEDKEKRVNVNELHDRLFRLGSGLLSETTNKRRLLEGDADVDPHAAVKKRLARRLTEYRSDLFYHPDGTVTVYIRSSMPDPTSSSRATTNPPLGTGSNRVDDCLQSRYANGDLGGGCHDAVKEFHNAVSLGSVTSRSFVHAHGAPADSTAQQRTLSNDRSVQPLLYGACGIFLSNLIMYSIVFVIIAVIVDRQLTTADDNADIDDDYEGAGEFDYNMLPEDDGKAIMYDHPHKEDATPQVYVGVPFKIQVV